MAKSFIWTYLENPNTRLYDIQNFLDYQKEIQDRISYKSQEWKDCEWLCVYAHDGLMVNPFCMTLYRTDKIEISGDYHERDYSKISIDFEYIACAKLELGKSWTATVGHTSPVPCSIKLSDLGDVLSDETVQKLRALVCTKPGKDYNCETIINQRNNDMSEPNESAEKVKQATDPDHYKGLKRLGVDSVVVLEDFMEMESTLTPTQKFLCATAMKYILRLGRKNSVDEDLQKAENYIHRARTGKWIPRELLGEK